MPETKHPDDVQVVERAENLEQFVKTIEGQAYLAKESWETLVVLMFGHGDPVLVPTSLASPPEQEKNHLELECFKQALPRSLEITLHDVVLLRPPVSYRQHINIRVLATSRLNRESQY